MNSIFDALCSGIIRPFRQEYSEQDLGPRIFLLKEYKIRRHLIQLRNNFDQILKCSYYQIEDDSSISRTIIIYAHSSNGSRIEGKEITRRGLANGYNIFTFDFSGCGLSEGDYISFGVKESEEIGIVVRYLKMMSKNSKIFLWGRSMGAVASILYCATDPSISGLILDSPFKNLKEVIHSKAKSLCGMPEFVIKGSVQILNAFLEKKKNFSFESIELEPIISHLSTPALFAASQRDTLVPFAQVKEMYEKFKGKKAFYVLQGDHNEERDEGFFNEVFLFLENLCGNE